MNRTSVFKSEAGRDRIRAYYNGILSRFPLTQRTVPTAFGETFVLEAGDSGNPPVVLLHGSCSNSAAWLGDMAALTAFYHVFAADIPGEPGNSEDRRLDFLSDEYPRWLCKVLDGLLIQRAVVIGNSMGGWLALQFAAAYPQRTAALALLAPSGIVEPKAAFLDRILDVAGNPDSAKAATDAVMGGADVPPEVLEFMALILDNFIPFTGALPVLDDAQVQSLSMPVLYIAGTGDAAIDSSQAAHRLISLAPHAQTILLDGAHVITTAANHIIPFLSKELTP